MRPLEHSLSMPAARGAPQRRAVMAFLGDEETAEAARGALADLVRAPGDIQRGGIDRAIEQLAGEPSPEVLLVDVGDSELPISDVSRLAEVCEPGVEVIAVGTRNDIGLYRDLLQAGVSDYLVKPLTPDLVRRAVMSVIEGSEPRSETKLGKLVVLTGSRGGVGTSTMAVNLAWHLAEKQGRRVALLDLDLVGGDCALLLNLKSTAGLRRALEAPERIDGVFITRAMARFGDKLSVLSAEEPFAEDIVIEPEALEVLLRALQVQFHYVVVDLPRSLRRFWPALSQRAAVRVIVADAVLTSLRDVRRFKKADGAGQLPGQTLLLLNRQGEFGRAGMSVADFTRGAELAPAVTVPFDRGLALAADAGAPAASSAGRIAAAIAALAGEISGQRPKRQSWWRIWL